MCSAVRHPILCAQAVFLFASLLSGCRETPPSTQPEVVPTSWWKPWQRLRPAGPAPLGVDVRVRWVGARSFPERQLRAAIEEQLTQIRNEGLTRPNADDAAYYTAVFYHQNGYARAEVIWSIHGKELLLEVREGRRFKLGSIAIEGNPNLTSATLLDLLTSVSVERLKVSKNRLPLVVSDLEAGASRISDRYRNDGFLNVVVSAPQIAFHEEQNTADVLVTVEEGIRYRFGPPDIRGPLSYPEEQIRAAIAPILALPFTPARLNALQATLEKFYANRGHFTPKIEVQTNLSAAETSGRVPISVSIQPGPRSVFHGVEIRGLERLRESWIRNRLHSLEGASYDPEKLSAKQQELLSSGIFEDLRISPVLQQDHSLKLEVEAREGRARELSFSGGFGNYEGLLGEVRASDRNLFGNALQGSAALAVSQRAIALEATLVNPWLFETRTQLLTRFFLRNRIELGYEKREGGVRAELSRRLFTPATAAVYAQVRSVEITNTDLPVHLLGSTAYQVATLGISGIYDRRDSVLNPTSGWIAGISADTHSLETGQAWMRATGRLTIHYPLPYRIRVAASGRFGLLSQSSSVPIDERFFLGGSTTVRSFQERGLGKLPSLPAPVGGASYSLLNLEADFPVWSKLRGALFFDAGSLTREGGTIPTSNFRKAVGVGARYALPVGPVRLDVGLNPDRAKGEPRATANLSFGFAF